MVSPRQATAPRTSKQQRVPSLTPPLGNTGEFPDWRMSPKLLGNKTLLCHRLLGGPCIKHRAIIWLLPPFSFFFFTSLGWGRSPTARVQHVEAVQATLAFCFHSCHDSGSRSHHSRGLSVHPLLAQQLPPTAAPPSTGSTPHHVCSSPPFPVPACRWEEAKPGGFVRAVLGQDSSSTGRSIGAGQPLRNPCVLQTNRSQREYLPYRPRQPGR